MISIVERVMTADEYKRLNQGFDEHSAEHNNPVEIPERFGFIAMDGDTFIGSATGLAYKANKHYNPYFYLSDLFVEKAYRKTGIGSDLLSRLEARIKSLGIIYVWTWTAGFEAPGFYSKQGYVIFSEMKGWYPSGHSRLGFIKSI